MSATLLPFAGEDRLRIVHLSGTRWLEHVTLWRPRDPDALTTGAHETAVILLGGTFDLVGGGTAWPARGARQDAFTGRPMAVFLPPHTPFHVNNGRGEILLVAARQPATREEPTGREAFASKPLLPLAGSGKSFDPNSGEWKPAETFPSAPESLPPRRFERIDVPVTGASAPTVALERVFAPDYKAATLSVDEVVLPAGSGLALAQIARRPACDEVLLFVRSEGEAALTISGRTSRCRGDGAFVASAEAFAAGTVQALTGRIYLALAYAGKQ